MGAKISSRRSHVPLERVVAGGWSELPRELLGTILEKLDLVAHTRFASVCSSWRSVAVEKPPINKPLYLALSRNPKNLVRRFITSFIPQRSWKQAWFIGAGLDGWLVLLINRKRLFLVNKAFNSIIPLPPPPKVHHSDPDYYPDYYFFEMPELSKAVLSSPPPPPSSSSPSSSSSGECTVVIKRNHGSRYLFYCHLPSDKSFSKLSVSDCGGIHDILFYKGQLYVICSPGNIIVIFDHLLNKVTQFDMCLENFIGGYSRRSQLLISENKLLLIIMERMYLLFEFEQSESRFIPVNYLNGNWSLLNLFCPQCSVSITADMYKEFRLNCDQIWISSSPNDNLRCVVLENHIVTNSGYQWPLFFFMFDHLGIV